MERKHLVGTQGALFSWVLDVDVYKRQVIVVEKEQFGGQIATTLDVVNYPGVEKTSGPELTETMRLQADNFGVEFLMAEAEELLLSGDIKTVKTSRGELSCFCVLLDVYKRQVQESKYPASLSL